ncbi:MAG: hypothetical protein A2W99_01060 [Bacteroidetes bacterium GWF2_33_16]|nr:MAG: hypothetical protein A2X00_03765 [Bacteroidetes bacterium GWE2_32_14]OFY08849.1 MAG: hypothetical protein A2W99_01060 [Bacteroidetes bacterium GWF2_33_16]
MSQQIFENKGLIIFDGYCNLCSSLVHFIIRKDKKDFFRFVALQSESIKHITLPFNLPSNYSESIILIIDDKIFFKSDAVLKIAAKLGGTCSILPGLRIIPKPIRDFLYDLIAKYRYKLFGKKNKCVIPTDNLKHKFIN